MKKLIIHLLTNTGRFLSRQSRDKLLEGTGIHTVPVLKTGILSREDYEVINEHM